MNYKEYFCEDRYKCLEKDKLTLKFISKFYRFGNPDEINGVVSYDSDIKILCYTKESGDLDLVFKYNRDIKNSGFKLKIDNKEIVIEAENKRGIKNGYIAFCDSLKKSGKYIYIPYLEIEHEPTISCSGVIEGFYGNPWSYKDRLDCIEFIGKNKMTTYMYAPKDDAYHRDKWRTLYPEEKIEEFKGILKECEKHYVDFYYMISPGNDFDFLNEKDYEVLKEKLKQIMDLGVSNFGLLMDDIEYRLSINSKRKFPTPADAQAYISNYVYDFLSENIEEFNLVMCPTEYDIDYDTPYLHTLGKKLNSQVKVFWTGNETLSCRITKESFHKITSILNHEIIIWDNVPVNDFETDKELIFIAPYKNRSKNLKENLGGLVLNPMDRWELSKFTLASFAGYAWNSHNFRSEEDFKGAIENVVGKDLVDEFFEVSKYFRNSRVSNSLPLNLEIILKEKDVKALDEELNILFGAIDKIKKEASRRILCSFNPWIIRLEKEKKLWDLFKNDKLDESKALIEELKNDKYKTPSNIIVRMVENIIR